MIKIQTEEIDDDWNPDASENTLLDKIVVNFTGLNKDKMITKNIQRLDEMEKYQQDSKIEEEQNNSRTNFKYQENEKLKKLTEEIFGDDNSDDENLMFDVSGLKEKLKEELLKDDFYDPLQDQKYEKWVNLKLSLNLFQFLSQIIIICFFKGKNQENLTILSCPCCFTQICYDCIEQNTINCLIYINRYNAKNDQYCASLVKNCEINMDKMLERDNKALASDQEIKQISQDEFIIENQLLNLGELDMKYQNNNFNKKFKFNVDMKFMVECSFCKTEIGYFDIADQLYYFKNSIPNLL